jgi:prevent-host-death family protein
MRIAVSDAKARLTDLVRRAEAGDEVILTRHGQPAAKIVPTAPTISREEKEALLDALLGAGKASFGPDAARSQDFLYDDCGRPA